MNYKILLLLILGTVFPLEIVTANIICTKTTIIKKSPLPSKKKKRRLKRKRLFKHKKVQGNQGEIPLLVSGVITTISGIITFVIGLVLANPIIWIIGLSFLFVGEFLLYFVILYMNSDASSYIFVFYIMCTLAGLAMLITGLILGVVALWVGGLVFLLPFVLMSVLLFLLARS